MKLLKDYLIENNVFHKCDVPYYKITRKNNDKTISYLIKPNSINDFKGLIRFMITEKIDFLVIGGLWNTYISENSKIKILISTEKLTSYSIENNLMSCQPGVKLKEISQISIENSVSGYVCFSGIPGTIGGSIVTNAGALSSEISKVVKYIIYLDEHGNEIKINNPDIGFKLRSSKFKRKELVGYITKIVLDFSKYESKNVLIKQYEEYNKHRLKFVDGKNNSLGSVFVSTTLNKSLEKFKFRFFIKSIFFRIFSLFIRDNFKIQKLNCKLTFLFLGNYKLHQHCDTINRFIWTNQTKEEDYFNYIKYIERITDNKAVMENQIF